MNQQTILAFPETGLLSTLSATELHYQSALSYVKDYNAVQFARGNFLNHRMVIIAVSSTYSPSSQGDPQVVTDIFIDHSTFRDLFPLLYSVLQSSPDRSLIDVQLLIHHSDQVRRIVTHSWPTSLLRALSYADSSANIDSSSCIHSATSSLALNYAQAAYASEQVLLPLTQPSRILSWASRVLSRFHAG